MQAGCWFLQRSVWQFAWLLARTPEIPGRTYAIYGVIYVVASLFWLWAVDGVRPTTSDAIGMGLAIAGMLVIVLGNLR